MDALVPERGKVFFFLIKCGAIINVCMAASRATSGTHDWPVFSGCHILSLEITFPTIYDLASSIRFHGKDWHLVECLPIGPS